VTPADPQAVHEQFRAIVKRAMTSPLWPELTPGAPNPLAPRSLQAAWRATKGVDAATPPVKRPRGPTGRPRGRPRRDLFELPEEVETTPEVNVGELMIERQQRDD
jgi:hypothetical protein